MEVVSSPDRDDAAAQPAAAAGGSRAGIGSSPATGSKRPMNAFLLFCKRHRAIVKEEYPNLENRNISKILGEWWQNLKEHERADFHNLASEFKEHVMREQPGFRWRRQPVLATSNANNSTSTTTTNNTAAAATNKSNVITKNGVREEVGRCKGGGVNSSPEPARRIPSLVETAESRSGGNNNSSSASSSTTTSITTTSSSAPKPFKKRILDAEKAKLLSVSPEAEQACKALMQLAGVRESSPSNLPATTSFAPTEGGDRSISSRPYANGSNNSRSGTSSPPSGDFQSKIESDHFNILKGNVWNRVAKDLIQQQKQRATDAATTSSDQPMNLSSQCTIFGQTIIEHIIENILDKPETNDHNLNNLATAEEIKERIYQELKEDSMRNPINPGEKESRTELWKLLPHVKLESKAGQTPTQNLPKPRPTPPLAPPPVQKVSAALHPAAPVILSLPLPQKSSIMVTNGGVEAKKNSCNQSLFGNGGKIDLKLLLASSPAPPTSPKQGNVSISLVSTPLSVVTTNTITSSATSKPLNLSTTPPQTPSLSLTPVKNMIPKSAPALPPQHSPVSIESTTTVSQSGAIKRKLVLENNPLEEDDEVRRSSRSCKGRRYQEFKDEGRLGKSRRSHHKSGDSSAGEDPNHVINLKQLPNEPPVNTQQQQQAQPQPLASGIPFDVTAKLNALPALRFDAYKQRFSTTAATKVSPSTGGIGANAAPSSTPKGATLQAPPTLVSSQRRRSSDNNSSSASNVNRPSPGAAPHPPPPYYGAVSTNAKRKTRRNANGANGNKKEEGLDVVVTS